MNLLGSFTNFTGMDGLIILLIILVLFGAKKLPELARGMGSAIREFQKAKDEISDELQSASKVDVAKNQPQTPAATVPRIEEGSGRSAADPSRSADRAGADQV